jgi:hypothetical protein
MDKIYTTKYESVVDLSIIQFIDTKVDIIVKSGKKLRCNSAVIIIDGREKPLVLAIDSKLCDTIEDVINQSTDAYHDLIQAWSTYKNYEDNRAIELWKATRDNKSVTS